MKEGSVWEGVLVVMCNDQDVCIDRICKTVCERMCSVGKRGCVRGCMCACVCNRIPTLSMVASSNEPRELVYWSKQYGLRARARLV